MNSQIFLIDEYDQKIDLYEAFRISAETAIRELLRLEGIQVHSLSSRTKNRSSFSGKIERDGKDSYETLGDITDIVGLRIITHIEDEVDKVGELIRREFVIDPQNSIDKRLTLDPDRFGYLSLHFICKFSEQRTMVAENRRFCDLKFEVQIRSILQHAWAEIEHDLGYKAGSTIPTAIRRRFSRLAGLLEIADDEFRRLRDELSAYAQSVPGIIKTSPRTVTLDDVSLASFIKTNNELLTVDKSMADFSGRELTDGKWESMAAVLNHVGLSTIEDVSLNLKEYKDVVVSQWCRRMENNRLNSGGTLRHGIALYHLWQVLAVKSGGEEGLNKAFDLVRGGLAIVDRAKLSELISQELRAHNFL